MSVIITSKSLLPVRRDKQIATTINIVGGGGTSFIGTSGQPPAYISIINGTPAAGQVAVFHDASTIEGDSGLTYNHDTKVLGIDQINEITNNHGIIIDGTLIKDNIVDAQDGDYNNLTITSGDAGGSGKHSGALFLKAGSAIWGDNTTSGGTIYLIPGSDYSSAFAGTISLGHDMMFKGNQIQLIANGTETDITLALGAKNNGSLILVAGGTTYLGGNPLVISAVNIILGDTTADVSLYLNETIEATGKDLYIRAGTVLGSTGNYNGGALHLYGGIPLNSGTTGKIYIGTGSGGDNPLAGSGTGTSILYYNRATGEITYGDK